MDARAAQRQPHERAETTIELSYNLYLTTQVQLQPDLQWVINPGTNPAVANAVVVGLRGLLTLEFS
jgi:porin